MCVRPQIVVHIVRFIIYMCTTLMSLETNNVKKNRVRDEGNRKLLSAPE